MRVSFPGFFPLFGAAVLGAACSQSQEFRSVLDPAAPPPPGTSAGADSAKAPPAPPCAVGACKPTVIARDQGLDPTNPAQQGTYAVVADDAWVYFMTAFSEIVRVPKTGGTPEKLADTDSQPTMLRLLGGHLYFESLAKHDIVRMPKGGGPVEDVTPPRAPDDWDHDVVDFVFDGATIAWFDMKLVHRCDRIPCGAVVDLEPNGAKDLPGALGVGYGHVLVATWQENVPEGTGRQVQALGEGGIVEMLPLDYRGRLLLEPDPNDARRTLVYGAAPNTVVRGEIPGATPPEVLASGPAIDMFPAGLALDATYVYWVNRGAPCVAGAVDCTPTKGNVMRVRKDGAAKPEIVLADQPPLRDLALAPDALFLTAADGTVLRLAKPADSPLH